jgi:HEAT repeat protein
MPFSDQRPPLIDLRGERSSASVLVSMAVVGALAYLLYYVGALGWLIGLFSRLVRWAIRVGFKAWEFSLSWASWWGLLLIAAGLLAIGFVAAADAPIIALFLAGVVTFMGVTSCLAYMFVDIERYDVERGYRALHNPLNGQQLAPHLARYGEQVGVMFLVAATAATAGGFALLNQGLYESVGTDWYRVDERGVGAVDFLAYAMLNLLRVVDVLDLARSKHLLDLAYVRPARWPAGALIILFRSFFTLVLLQQVFASIRQGRLLAETIADFWSPHEPIHQRARNALPQYGPAAIAPLLVSLRAVAVLTREQRDQLPLIVAAIGPSTVPTLVRHLRDPHEQVRAVAAAALGHLNAREAVPALAALAGDPSHFVRQSLADGLGLILAAAARSDRTERGRRHRGRRLRFGGPARGRPTIDPIPAALAGLGELLTDDNPAVRTQAAVAVGRGGRAAAAAIPDLVRRLGDADETVRCRAAETLGQLDPESDEAVRALVDTLTDPSAAVRAATARGLAALGPAARAAVPDLMPLLQDQDADVRTLAADAIAQAGQLDESTTATLVRGLASPDNVVRAQTAEALGTVGAPAGEAAAALARVLRDNNDVVRAKAAAALGKIGEAAADVAVPSLVRALRDRDSWVSALAAEALAEMGEAADAAAPALIRALGHVNAQVRANAALALGRLGTDAERARTALERAAGDDDGGVRAQAVRALGRLGSHRPRSLELILGSLDDPDPQVREAGAEAVGHAERPPGDVERLLVPLLADANDQVKVQAARVLADQVGPTPDVINGLGHLLTVDDSTWVQVHAGLALARLGPAAASAGLALFRVARTGEAAVREQAMKALAMIQPPEAAGAFVAGLKDPSAEVRLIASAGWVKADSVPDVAIQPLVDALRDPESQVRANAALALSRVENLPAEAIPLLVDCTADPSDRLRLNATLALRFAPPAGTLGVMEGLLDDPSPRVRVVAAGAVLAAVPAHGTARAVADAGRTDPSPRVREAAEELLQSLEAPADDVVISDAAWSSPPEVEPVSVQPNRERCGGRGLAERLGLV